MPKRDKKDPAKPKGRMSAYACFVKECRAEKKAQARRGGTKMPKSTRISTSRWQRRIASVMKRRWPRINHPQAAGEGRKENE